MSDFNSKWSAFSGLDKKYNITLPNRDDIEKIHKLAFQVKQKGVTSYGINKLRDLINKSTSTNVVLIALTELSILLESQKKKSKSGKSFIDTLEILAEKISNYYIQSRFPEFGCND